MFKSITAFRAGRMSRAGKRESYARSSSTCLIAAGSSTRRRATRLQRPAVEPLPHIDALLNGTRGYHFFTKLDLASSYHQQRMRAADRWKTSFRSQMGQFEWNVVQFGLQGALLADACDEPGPHRRSRLPGEQARWSCACYTTTGPPGDPRRGPAGLGPLGRCALVYMDDCLVHSPTQEQSSKCEFGLQELGFLGLRLSAEGMSVDPRKVQSGEADVVLRGASLHRAGQLLPPFRGGLRRGRGAADRALQPDSAIHVDGRDPGERRLAEAGSLLGTGIAHLR